MKRSKYKFIKHTKRLRQLNKKITKKDKIFKLKSFVQSLDLSPLENTLSLSERGQHPIPLWVPVCVWMYAYDQGELRYRVVQELCIKHDDYYWLSAGFEPSGSYLESWKLRILPRINQLKVLLPDFLH